MESGMSLSFPTANKRARDATPDAIPDAKRFREASFIFEMLEDEDIDYDDSNVDVTDVVRSLEREIDSDPSVKEDDANLNIGYLLEASDDELGLPPAVGLSTDGEDDAGFGRIWGFEDDVSDVFLGQTGFGSGVIFDGEFDYAEDSCEVFPWLTESLTTSGVFL